MSEQRALRLGVVGLGQCGGNLAAEFAARGYPALALNTSQTDLRALEGLEASARLYLGIDGINGTGGSREIGQQCVLARAEEIQAAVEGLGAVDALVVAGGLGGGTGASLADVVQQVATAQRPVLALGVLPASSEPYAAKRTALQALNGLLDGAFEALMLVDNERLLGAFGSAGMDQFFPEGNRAVVEAVDALNALVVDEQARAVRTFDPAQLRETLLSGGVTLGGRADLALPLEPEALLRAAGDIAREHPALGCGYALEDAACVSAVLVVDADTLADTPASVVGAFTEQLKEACGGAAVHLGVYGAAVSAPALHVMLGGLPLPGRPGALLEEAAREAQRFGDRRSPRSRLRKLDLSALVAMGPPSAPAKGMVKSRGPDAPQGDAAADDAGDGALAAGDPDAGGPVVDLDFEPTDAPGVEEEIVEEEIVDDFGGDLEGGFVSDALTGVDRFDR